MMLAAAFVLLAGVPSSQETIEERVRSALESSFGAAPDELRRDFVARLSVLFRSSPPAPRVLDGLPEAAREHSERVDAHRKELGSRPEFAATIAEGYSRQLAALEQRVRQVLSRPTSEETRSDQLRQIDTLISAARRTLSTRLPGAAGEGLVDRELDTLQRTWKASLDRPFASLLPAPLSPSDLDAVLRRILDQEGRPPLTNLDADDLGSPDPRVRRILREVEDAFHEATDRALGSPTLVDLRAREWESEMDCRRAKSEPGGCLRP
jgi:hypothetical protein